MSPDPRSPHETPSSRWACRPSPPRAALRGAAGRPDPARRHLDGGAERDRRAALLDGPPGEQDTSAVVVSAVITFVTYFLYEGALLARSGQTLGKKALRIRVAMLADGDVPGRQGWSRAAVYALPGTLCWALVGTLFWLCNVLWQLRDRPFHQCLHDKAARTVVVSAV
ncbi:RDD family protein [Streptomyces sp. M19]